MSLSAWEQQALDSITEKLMGSDPSLTALLATFTQLTSGEDMPLRERIRPPSRCSARYWRHLPRYRSSLIRRTIRLFQRLGLQGAAMLLWLLLTVTLITAALALCRSHNPHTCTSAWAVVCASPAPTHGVGSAARSPGRQDWPVGGRRRGGEMRRS
jgi:hypothetical protein